MLQVLNIICLVVVILMLIAISYEITLGVIRKVKYKRSLKNGSRK